MARKTIPPMLSIEDVKASAVPASVMPASAPAAVREPEKEPRLTLTVPSSVMEDLKRQATAQGTTVRTVVLKALAAAGVAVPEAEIQDKRAVIGQKRKGLKA